MSPSSLDIAINIFIFEGTQIEGALAPALQSGELNSPPPPSLSPKTCDLRRGEWLGISDMSNVSYTVASGKVVNRKQFPIG